MKDIRLLKDGVCIGRLQRAVTMRERMVGLLGRAGLPEGHGLLIERCSSIHTCFMLFPLDLVFLAPDGAVTGIRHGIRPWRMALGPVGTRCVVEFETGKAGAASDLRCGDRVVVEGLYPFAAST
jgi:uncharacterized membrane protein (UPF0127 family)